MIALGVVLVILGVGSLVLPNLGLDLAFLDTMNTYQPWAGIIVAALGLITVLFGAQRRGRKEVVVEAAAAAPAAAVPPPAASSTAVASTPAAQPATDVDAVPPPPPPDASPDPAAPTPSDRAWPTEPPERSDD